MEAIFDNIVDYFWNNKKYLLELSGSEGEKEFHDNMEFVIKKDLKNLIKQTNEYKEAYENLYEDYKKEINTHNNDIYKMKEELSKKKKEWEVKYKEKENEINDLENENKVLKHKLKNYNRIKTYFKFDNGLPILKTKARNKYMKNFKIITGRKLMPKFYTKLMLPISKASETVKQKKIEESKPTIGDLIKEYRSKFVKEHGEAINKRLNEIYNDIKKENNEYFFKNVYDYDIYKEIEKYEYIEMPNENNREIIRKFDKEYKYIIDFMKFNIIKEYKTKFDDIFNKVFSNEDDLYYINYFKSIISFRLFSNMLDKLIINNYQYTVIKSFFLFFILSIYSILDYNKIIYIKLRYEEYKRYNSLLDKNNKELEELVDKYKKNFFKFVNITNEKKDDIYIKDNLRIREEQIRKNSIINLKNKIELIKKMRKRDALYTFYKNFSNIMANQLNEIKQYNEYVSKMYTDLFKTKEGIITEQKENEDDPNVKIRNIIYYIYRALNNVYFSQTELQIKDYITAYVNNYKKKIINFNLDINQKKSDLTKEVLKQSDDYFTFIKEFEQNKLNLKESQLMANIYKKRAIEIKEEKEKIIRNKVKELSELRKENTNLQNKIITITNLNNIIKTKLNMETDKLENIIKEKKETIDNYNEYRKELEQKMMENERSVEKMKISVENLKNQNLFKENSLNDMKKLYNETNLELNKARLKNVELDNLIQKKEIELKTTKDKMDLDKNNEINNLTMQYEQKIEKLKTEQDLNMSKKTIEHQKEIEQMVFDKEKIINNYELNIDKIKSELAITNENKELLTKQNNELVKNQKEMESKINEITTKNEHINAMNVEMNAINTELKKKIKDLEKLKESMAEKLFYKKLELFGKEEDFESTIEKQKKLTEDRIKTTEEIYNFKKKENEILQDYVNELESKMDKIEMVNKQYDEVAETYIQNHDKLQSFIKEAFYMYKYYKNFIDEKKKIIDKIENYKQIEERYKQLQKDYTKLFIKKTEQVNQDVSEEELENEMNFLRVNIENLEKQLDQKDKQIKSLSKSINMYEEDLENHKLIIKQQNEENEFYNKLIDEMKKKQKEKQEDKMAIDELKRDYEDDLEEKIVKYLSMYFNIIYYANLEFKATTKKNKRLFNGKITKNKIYMYTQSQNKLHFTVNNLSKTEDYIDDYIVIYELR